MPNDRVRTRLYVNQDLAPSREIQLERDQSHYLVSVLRLGQGAWIGLFNGRAGEWTAEIIEAGRRGVLLRVGAQMRDQTEPPDLWLCFAPIKKARTDFIAEKAAEMGCRRLVPVFTRHTNSERVRIERLQAHAVEAAEQCGLVSVPEVAEPVRLEVLLDNWPDERRLMFCDESGAGAPADTALRAAGPGPWAVLTGPEGGFSAEEATRIGAMAEAVPVSLGPRILRADTAAVAALALWQSVLGDWQ